MKDGKTEIYDLSNPQQKAAFEKKYGPMPATRVQEPNSDPKPSNEQNSVIIVRKEDRQSNLVRKNEEALPAVVFVRKRQSSIH